MPSSHWLPIRVASSSHAQCGQGAVPIPLERVQPMRWDDVGALIVAPNDIDSMIYERMLRFRLHCDVLRHG